MEVAMVEAVLVSRYGRIHKSVKKFSKVCN